MGYCMPLAGYCISAFTTQTLGVGDRQSVTAIYMKNKYLYFGSLFAK
jgi:hypothetical protein